MEGTGIAVIHESKEVSKIEVTDIELTFSDIYEKPYFPKEHAEEIQRANALIIPYDEGFRDHNNPLFPEESVVFFQYVQDASNGTEVTFDICASDEQFHELELHADLINIPNIIMTVVAFPIVTGLITNYLYDKMKSRRTDLKVKVNLIVETEGKSKRISYEGDADKFESTIKAINLLDE
ncbi:hypothetical protein [Paenibacillus tuaregi]|uniref:hypothetical protein n=1 Tax=Paenibacillus tuaregi TaxID=1816681 RepID=UPI001F379399|nr:hypothetical protein [Paenibacillus tuaregi]